MKAEYIGGGPRDGMITSIEKEEIAFPVATTPSAAQLIAQAPIGQEPPIPVHVYQLDRVGNNAFYRYKGVEQR